MVSLVSSIPVVVETGGRHRHRHRHRHRRPHTGSQQLVMSFYYLCCWMVSLSTISSFPLRPISTSSTGTRTITNHDDSNPSILVSRQQRTSLSSSMSISIPSLSRRRMTQLGMVFERMSEECVELLVCAQQETQQLHTTNSNSGSNRAFATTTSSASATTSLPTSIDTIMIFVGCCSYAFRHQSSLQSSRRGAVTTNNNHRSPSLIAIQKTLHRYNVSKRRMDAVLSSIYHTNNNNNSNNNDSNSKTESTSTTELPQWLNQFRNTNKATASSSTSTDRPFATSSKYSMNRAMQIANAYQNPMIECHYLFLALMDYQPSTGTLSTTTIPTDASATESNEVWTKVISKLVSRRTDDTNNSNIKNKDDATTYNAVISTTSNNNNSTTTTTTTTTTITALEICQTCIMYYDQEIQRRKGRRELVLATNNGNGGDKTTKASGGIMDEIGTDLTQMAQDGLLDQVYGRDVEINSCLRTLLRRRKNNIILLGNAGVGKTAIVEGLAQYILDPKKCPKQLMNSRIISIEISNLLANTKYRGEFEERLQSIISEVTQSQEQQLDNELSSSSSSSPLPPRIILFFDEIHTIMGTGNAGGGEGGSIDAANILKPALARGTIQLIGATTIEEYRSSIEKDTAFARRLQPVYISEPNSTQSMDMIQNCISYYEDYHMVQYTVASIRAAVELSERYINDRFLPDKAIDLIDEAGAMIQLQLASGSGSSNNNNNDNNDNNNDNTWDPNSDDMSYYDDSEMKYEDRPVVTEEIMMQLISEWTGIPLGKIELSEQERLLSIEQLLSARVIGQKRPIVSVSRAIRRARSGLQDPKRPIASFLFCGPTGVGKTELCKSLADVYYGNEKDMIRIDMSEYQDRYTVSRLTGPPPGYVGYESGGQLTEAVRRNAHSVILLDEIEKAHEDVLNILLQVLEDGILTDGKGRTVNFKNTIIVMTSNVGSRRILDLCRTNNESSLTIAPPSSSSSSSSSSGLDTIRNSMKDTLATSDVVNDIGQQQKRTEEDHHLYPQLIEVVKEELENTMKPELLNRIDEIVVFSPLSNNNLIRIAQLNVDRIVKRINDEHNITISVSGTILDRIVNDGSTSADQFGARPMRRATQRYVEDSISDAYIQGFIRKNDCAMLSIPDESQHDNDDFETISERVIVTKSIHNENGETTTTSLLVEIVDSSGGIGSSPSSVNRSQKQQQRDLMNAMDDDESQDNTINGKHLDDTDEQSSPPSMQPMLKTSPSQ